MGTFNYLGYDESEVPQQTDSGKGRNLAEQYDKAQTTTQAAPDASQYMANASSEDKQDQTHQLQASFQWPLFSSIYRSLLAFQSLSTCSSHYQIEKRFKPNETLDVTARAKKAYFTVIIKDEGAMLEKRIAD